MSYLFQVKGVVLPVTLDHCDLVAEYDDGTQVKSEHLIDEPLQQKENRISRLFLEPSARAYEGAVQAIQDADVIIAGPGDLYTTTLANIVVPGIATAIQESKALFVFVNNLMTKKGQTHGMGALDIVEEITRYTKRSPDVVLLHEGSFPTDILIEYEKQYEYPIIDDLGSSPPYRVVREDLVNTERVMKDQGDHLKRSLIRHDTEKLAKSLYKILSTSEDYALTH